MGAVLLFWAAVLPAGTGAAAYPVVANVTAAQRAGTKLVDITYDLADPDSPGLSVTIRISSDNGATWTVPASHVTGDVGPGIKPGTGKKIVWDAGADWNNMKSDGIVVKVIADDGPAGVVFIPGGTFLMGDPTPTGEGYSNEKPAHSVTVSSFYMDRYEVTKALWDEVYTWATAHGYTFDNSGTAAAADHPVQSVYWYDAVKWLNARSEREGRMPVYYTDGSQTTIYRTGRVDITNEAVKWSADGYRLPTEAEWEYAARAGTATRFYTGDCISAETEANYDGRYPWNGCPTGTFRHATTAVGTFPPNPWGLYDMTGNVWEWVWDRYGSSYYSSSPSYNPYGPASGSDRVNRGGGWQNSGGDERSSRRGSAGPAYRDDDLGFRSVLRVTVPAGMVRIPGGTFQMGDASGVGGADERPAHSVTVSSFYMDRYEVTKALWDEVYTWATAHGYSFDNLGSATAENHPVQSVSWYDAIKWLNARSEREGRMPVYYTGGSQTAVYRTGQIDISNDAVKWTADGYRLPTEAEWEYAARAGTVTHFYTGECLSADAQANYDGSYPWNGCPAGKVHGGTTAVGSFSANPWGLYDMTGNVWEWVWDWYDPTYYSSGPSSDPRGPASGSNRVFRGGSWSDDAGDLRLAKRRGYTPASTFSHRGFRSVIREP
ncbi:MAG TPA: SUMF1/EgtB/PvdO family nonheme iron enzyme [Syntrophales bacterium]|nr:SUMF1/EgtB/PvdO family nonheme iron enzyme [Syntrophales bacterium]HOU78574.1 SUMF1/EgtB/PvdO family nonheme iron enzyme [Syntrophales bacterium]HPC33663.1 SUMF1/EgtB/PvdO family nonheme iron enzyme [Syntrophales bacterium]HQI36740.1 SUMF1/EgtB/PvdO family nonheme iron enzyme [Syntrophales bacterium]HRR48268.1 SUMF1/EgtB/PvdO family nonheme iron enzyme [Syntrophales bacterium]